MEPVKVVGANLRATRAHRGLSLSEVARRAELGKGTLSELEAGQRNPTLETLYALATVLDVPLGQLLTTEADAPVETGLVVRRAGEAELAGQAVDVQLVDRTADGGQTWEIYPDSCARREPVRVPGTPAQGDRAAIGAFRNTRGRPGIGSRNARPGRLHPFRRGDGSCLRGPGRRCIRHTRPALRR